MSYLNSLRRKPIKRGLKSLSSHLWAVGRELGLMQRLAKSSILATGSEGSNPSPPAYTSDFYSRLFFSI